MICSIIYVQTAVPYIAIQIRELGVADGYGVSNGNREKLEEKKVHFGHASKRGNCVLARQPLVPIFTNWIIFTDISYYGLTTWMMVVLS